VAITIEPLGGLGNQLFVYATGRALALDTGAQLHVDLRNFVGYDWHAYELNSFDNRIDRTCIDKSYVGNSVRRAYRQLQSRLPIRIPRTKTFREVSWTFDANVLNLTDGARLVGYFQSPKYFERHAGIIRTEVFSIREPSAWFLQKSEELAERGAWIGLHVRRGNYSFLPNMGLLGQNYYSQALGYLRNLEGDLPVVVFSDDIDAARTLLGETSEWNLEFFQAPEVSKPVESLVLMSQAHHLVSANSTFSWWAAWLGDGKDRTVICPRPWLNDPGHDDRDLVPDTWISVSRT